MDLAETETILLRPRAFMAEVACPVRWHRSTRARRVSLKICPREAAVIVTLPARSSRRAGMALLTEHAAWVTQRLAAIEAPPALAHGAEIPVGDVPHRIVHAPERRGAAPPGSGADWIEDGALIVTGAAEFLPRRVADLLRAEAARRIGAALGPHAEALGVRPSAVRLKDTQSRWGSRASNGTLSFSWRLVMAPGWVLDYVVAHEAAHLRELNHSPRFWALVEARTPHRRAATEWLKRHGPRLLRVG
jgi:predicted metal-dependent hydrolase